jgi:hypothetical protein
MAEAPETALGRGQLVNLYEASWGHCFDHELSDPVAAVHFIGFYGIGIYEQHHELVTVAGVDEAGGVQERDPVAQRQATAGLDKTRVALRYGYSQPRGHQGAPSTRGDRDVGARTDVGTGIARTGVIGEREVWVELDNLYHHIVNYRHVVHHRIVLHVRAGHAQHASERAARTAR